MKPRPSPVSPSDSPPERPGLLGRRWWLWLFGAVLVIGLIFCGDVVWKHLGPRSAEPVPVVPRTTARARETERKKDLNEIILPGLQQPITEHNHPAWTQVLWTLKWTYFRGSEAIDPLRQMLAQLSWPEETQRLLLETIYTIQPKALVPEMRGRLSLERHPRHWAMIAAYVHRATGDMISLTPEQRTLFGQDPRVVGILAETKSPRRKMAVDLPPLADLLKAPWEGRPVVFSFQRTDRNFIGRAIIRQRNGSWLRSVDGSLWTVPQFARSVSNLPGTITNGNTPAGILEVREFSFANVSAIGPTEALTLGLPGEYEAWSHDRYQALLPATWQQYWPLQEAWWAGQVQRTEIMAHGTTIDPEWWRDMPFYPLTPSHGCLTCHEEWSPTDGQRLHSEQARLIAALKKAGGTPSWLVVIERDPSPTAAGAGMDHVSAAELEALIAQLPGS